MLYFVVLFFSQSFFPTETKLFYPQVPTLAESAHSYNALHYLLRLELPMDVGSFAGSVTMAAKSNINNLRVVDMHSKGLNIDSLRVNGQPATYVQRNDTLFVDLPSPQNQGDSFAVMVGYNGSSTGLMGYVFFQGWPNVSYTLGCPYSTREWMPCWDRLADKADHGVEFYITVPDSFVVTATGQYLGRTVAQGKATYHWKHNFPISPYLVHFASSIFKTYSDWYRPSPAESVEIKYYFWPDDSLYARNAFSLTTDMMQFYDSLFGSYPFERYGMDVVAPFFYGGMEHQTMATITRGWIVNPDYYGIAHEMSHMWWGDMVTCHGWENVWLNEGFGTYCDALYRGKREGQAAFISTMNGRKSAYFQGEARSPHPIYNPPPSQLFEWSHSYCKGSWVLHMIRFLSSTDARWLSLMAAYRDSFEYKAASTDDLNRIMNQILGGNYDWFFQEWVYDMGYPIYSVTWRTSSEPPNWRLIMDIVQTQTIGPPVFHMPLPVGANYASGDTVVTVPISQSPQHYECVLPREPLSITVDPRTWILQRNSITTCNEQSVMTLRVPRIQTVGRIIRVSLPKRTRIRIFDISGRKTHESYTDELRFNPGRAGIFQVFAGEDIQRVVVIH